MPSPSLSPKDPFAEEALAHLDALYGVACKLTRNPTEAEDLVQDALVKAMRGRDQFQSGTNLKAWLFRILTNTFINKYRRGGLERTLFEGPDADPLADWWVSPLLPAFLQADTNAAPHRSFNKRDQGSASWD